MKSKIKNKGILVVSHQFAPSMSAGGKRFTFLSPIIKSKYPDLHILTLKKRYFSPRDDGLTFAGTAHRTGAYPAHPFNGDNILKKILNWLWVDYLCLIDPNSGWIIPAVIRGLKVIKDNDIELIIASCPPFSAIVVGFLLSRLTGTKLILDYRDPWSNHNRVFCKLFGKKIGIYLERQAVKQASALVFCSRIMEENFARGFADYTKAPRYVVTNGFHQRNGERRFTVEEDKKNIIYAGTTYGKRRMSFLPTVLLKLLNEGTITRDNCCVHIFGRLTDGDGRVFEEYALHDLIKIHPFLPYDQMIGYLESADILFLISAAHVRYAIPLKFFDYLSVRRPILAVAGEDSAVAELMNEIDCGRLALINNEESIVETLREMLQNQKEYSFTGAENYTWNEIGIKYLKVIDRVAAGN